MSFYLNEKEANSFNEIDIQDFFENFEKYIDIRFEDTIHQIIPTSKKIIARNLRKEFDNYSLQTDEINLKSEPIFKNKVIKQGFFHNFFCLCFNCQTKKYVQRKRTDSIKLSNRSNSNLPLNIPSTGPVIMKKKENQMPNNFYVNGENGRDSKENQISKQNKKSFILKNGKIKAIK